MDDIIFKEQFKEIAPLKVKKKVLHSERKKPSARLLQQPDFSDPIISHKRHINKPSSVTAEEYLSFHQTGVQERTLKQLQQGKLAIEGMLDLHGYTLAQVDLALEKFIHDAYHNNKRILRLIHGKGRSQTEPPIKNALNLLLRENSLVLAFSSAPARLGGTGVVHVLLKKNNIL